MNAAAHHRFARVRRLLIVAAVALLCAAAPVAWIRPHAILPAYRLAVFACLAPALGSILFALVHRCTGGQWGDTLRPFLATGCRLAPWLWLFVGPILFFAPDAAAGWSHYDSRAMIAFRSVGYGLVLFTIAAWLTGRRFATAPWVGPVGLIVLAFTLHLLAEDWFAALDPGWHSTAFPLVWMLGEAVAGLGCAVLAALLCGRSPGEISPPQSRAPGLDWGNLLLTAAMLWCYVAFAQFLIIWSGNLPREISWFTQRVRGGWAVVPIGLAALQFVVPLAILLSRRLKRSTAGLGAAALTLVVGQGLFIAWMILPAFAASRGLGLLLELAAATGAAALFFQQYLRLAARRLETS